jgi:hypothetical protein
MFYRILPFVLLSFFSLHSVLQQNLSGLILVSGALMTSLLPIGISNIESVQRIIINYQKTKADPDKDVSDADLSEYQNTFCNFLTYNNTLISYLPLSTHIISFIVGYMTHIAQNNVLLFMTLCVFLLIDVGFNFLNCASYLIIIPLLFGYLLGFGWGSITGVDKLTTPSEKCSTTKKSFECKTMK